MKFDREYVTMKQTVSIRMDILSFIHKSIGHRNRIDRLAVLDKLQTILLKAYPRPKVRKMRKGISKKAKARNKENKKRRSDVKNNRKKVDF